MTNVADAHTCTIGGVNLILVVVLFTESHLFQLSSEMVGGAAVEVPVGVDAVGAISRRNDLVIILRVVLVFIISVPRI